MASSVKVIALTQLNRGQGVSTAAFFLGKSLTDQRAPVLLTDLIRNNTTLHRLKDSFGMRGMVLWTPRANQARNFGQMVASARIEVEGRATCILLDVDHTFLERQQLERSRVDVDYLLIFSGPTEQDERNVDYYAQKFETLIQRRRIGIVFSKVDPADRNILPQQTRTLNLPAIGALPADYFLAGVNDFGYSDGRLSALYQTEIMTMARSLIQLVPIPRRS